MSVLCCSKNMSDERSRCVAILENTISQSIVWPLQFTSLLLAGYTHPIFPRPPVLSHYNTNLTSTMSSFKSGPVWLRRGSSGATPSVQLLQDCLNYCEPKRQIRSLNIHYQDRHRISVHFPIKKGESKRHVGALAIIKSS